MLFAGDPAWRSAGSIQTMQRKRSDCRPNMPANLLSMTACDE